MSPLASLEIPLWTLVLLFPSYRSKTPLVPLALRRDSIIHSLVSKILDSSFFWSRLRFSVVEASSSGSSFVWLFSIFFNFSVREWRSEIWKTEFWIDGSGETLREMKFYISASGIKKVTISNPGIGIGKGGGGCAAAAAALAARRFSGRSLLLLLLLLAIVLPFIFVRFAFLVLESASVCDSPLGTFFFSYNNIFIILNILN